MSLDPCTLQFQRGCQPSDACANNEHFHQIFLSKRSANSVSIYTICAL